MRTLLVIGVLFVAACCQKTFIGDQVLRITARDEEELNLIKSLESLTDLELDFWKHPVNPDLPIDIHVPFAILQDVKVFLESNNIQYSILIEEIQKLLDDERKEMEANQITLDLRSTDSFNYGAYHNLDTIYKWMDNLVAEYPSLVSKQQIGSTYEGRPMYILKFSTGSNRPAIWIDAGIHSREWVTQATAIWTGKEIAAQYGKDATVTSVLNNLDIILLPVTNPDGYAYSHTSDRMWRKTRSKNSGSTCIGVDPNRNWDAGFSGPGSSSSPCSDSYRGPYPHSEIEVQNVVNFITTHGRIKAFISIHSYSQLLMIPYGYKCTVTSHHTELMSVATSAAQALTSLYGTRYQVGPICTVIYQASGGSIDWTYDHGIRYSFAFELRDTGYYGFLLPANQIIPTAQETWLALKVIAGYVRDHPY